MALEVWASAYKHGCADADIRHAYRNAVTSTITDSGMVMLIGPALDPTMLEIGLGRSGAVVHAAGSSGPDPWSDHAPE